MIEILSIFFVLALQSESAADPRATLAAAKATSSVMAAPPEDNPPRQIISAVDIASDRAITTASSHQTMTANGPPLKVELIKESSPWWKDLLPFVISTLGISVAGFSVWVSWRYNDRTLRYKAHEDEIKDIRDKLNNFYGPFRQLLTTSANLYRLFAKGKPADFRTLTELIDGAKYGGNDKVLLDQIIEVTQLINQLITEKAGLIDESLQPLIAQASTHFRLMQLASKGELSGDSDRFKDDVFPRNLVDTDRDLNFRIDKEIERLKSRLSRLVGFDSQSLS